jgi:hypothetical protein
MRVAFEETPEYLLGRQREKEFLRHLASRGNHAFPAYGAVGVDEESRSPKVWTPSGKIIAPDILCITPDGLAVWCEVKAKTKPTFRWQGEHRGFHHGVDYRLFHSHYRVLAEQCKALWLVVCESMTLPYDDWTPDYQRPKTVHPDGKENWDEYEDGLVPGPVWLAIEYHDAVRKGRYQERWSHGKHGWLWPRSAMRKVDIDELGAE